MPMHEDISIAQEDHGLPPHAHREGIVRAASRARRTLSPSPTSGHADGALVPLLPEEIAFLTQFGAKRQVLASAMQTARQMGVSADHALLCSGALTDTTFYRALARHLGVPFGVGTPALPEDADLPTVLESGVVPLTDNPQGLRFAFAPRGKHIGALMALAQRGAGARPAWSITTPQNLAHAVRAIKGNQIAGRATEHLGQTYRGYSAKTGMTRWQRAFVLLLATLLAMGFALCPEACAMAVFSGAGLVFLVAIATRLAATCASIHACTTPVLAVKPPRAADETLPIYSIIVPLHKEANIVPQLIGALNALDYPLTRLDIKLVLEAGDSPTLAALEEQTLTACHDIIIAPPGAPQTKPRALNIALPFVRGAYCAIFDAEDIPEPDQPRLAVEKFRACPQTTACLQASLLIDNTHDSWITTLFTLEYAALFDVVNPGLANLGLPILLGGTSNHFRTDCLRAIAGWDAYNVTEDADLGMRIARLGFGVEALGATTHEEAPRTLHSWLSQRRRWLKGWMQTAITHARNPIQTVREIGFVGTATSFSILLGTVLGALFAPVFMALLGIYLYDGRLMHPQTALDCFFSAWALIICSSGLIAIAWPAWLGLKRRGLTHLWGAIVLLPLYYFLLTLAAWSALYSLVTAPFHWHKTPHGLAKTSRLRQKCGALQIPVQNTSQDGASDVARSYSP